MRGLGWAFRAVKAPAPVAGDGCLPAILDRTPRRFVHARENRFSSPSPHQSLFPKLGGCRCLPSREQLKCKSTMYEQRMLSCVMVGEDTGPKQGRRGEEGGGVAGGRRGVAVAEAKLLGLDRQPSSLMLRATPSLAYA
jgi:hypothetical protein